MVIETCRQRDRNAFPFLAAIVEAPLAHQPAPSLLPGVRTVTRYVGELKCNRKVEWKGRVWRVDGLAAPIPPKDRKELRCGDQRPWYFTCTLHLPKVNHKVRIVVIWDHRRDAKPRKVLVTNRTTWEVCRIVRTYRHRWTGTETYHRDGKQKLGMGDCQLRNGQGQTGTCTW